MSWAQYDNQGALLERSFSDTPVGTVQPYAGSNAPNGWLMCDGSAVSRTTYPELFGVVGTTYGAGNGSTTFNLPDMRGRVPAGKDDMGGSSAGRLTTAGSGVNGTLLGASGGAQTVTLSTAEMPAHNHSGSTSTDGSHVHTQYGRDYAWEGIDGRTDFAWGRSSAGGANMNTGSAGSHSHTLSVNNTGGGGAHNNAQPTVVLNYIIYAVSLSARLTTVTPVTSAPYVTGLPASPVDGQEVYYAADASNGTIWHLRYRSGSSSSYKWEFVGGPPMTASISANETATGSGWLDLATPGPLVTSPLAGEYIYLFRSDTYYDGDQRQSAIAISVNNAAPTVMDAFYITAAAASSATNLMGSGRVTVATAGHTIKMRYSRDATGTANFRWRHLQVVPVRVG